MPYIPFCLLRDITPAIVLCTIHILTSAESGSGYAVVYPTIQKFLLTLSELPPHSKKSF